MKQYGVAIERWEWQHRYSVENWLAENFGNKGERWEIEYDYDLHTLIMDEDVYLIYKLRWV